MTGRRDPRGYVPMRVEGVALERDLQWQVGDELLPLAHRWRRRIYGLAVIEDHAENGLKDGYINTQGKIAITPQFDHAYDFNEGVAEVQVFDQGANNSHGLIDKSGRRVADLTRSPTSALP